MYLFAGPADFLFGSVGGRGKGESIMFLSWSLVYNFRAKVRIGRTFSVVQVVA